MLLLQASYADLDNETEELESWEWIHDTISYNIKFLSELVKIRILKELALRNLFEYISYCYDAVSTFI